MRWPGSPVITHMPTGPLGRSGESMGAAWLRIDGRAVEETCNILSVPRLPVFSGIPIGSLRKEFLRILKLMDLRPLALDAKRSRSRDTCAAV